MGTKDLIISEFSQNQPTEEENNGPSCIKDETDLIRSEFSQNRPTEEENNVPPCIGAFICSGQEILCLHYAGFFQASRLI